MVILGDQFQFYGLIFHFIHLSDKLAELKVLFTIYVGRFYLHQ